MGGWFLYAPTSMKLFHPLPRPYKEKCSPTSYWICNQAMWGPLWMNAGPFTLSSPHSLLLGRGSLSSNLCPQLDWISKKHMVKKRLKFMAFKSRVNIILLGWFIFFSYMDGDLPVYSISLIKGAILSGPHESDCILLLYSFLVGEHCPTYKYAFNLISKARTFMNNMQSAPIFAWWH